MAVKIGIISDTHGLLREEVKAHLKGCDYIFHAGDHTNGSILEELSLMCKKIYAVRGNCDGRWAEHLSHHLLFELEGLKFLLVHDRLTAGRDLAEADVVVFGHTHRYFNELVGERLYLNPGTCGFPRYKNEVSMMIMTLDHGKYEIERIDLPSELFK